MRELALATVLHLYGGMLIPSSFICFYDLRRLYEDHLERANVMISELRTTSSFSAEKQFSPSTKIMGCRKFDPIMKEYMDFMMRLTEHDQTEEMDFTGKTTQWWLTKQAKLTSAVSLTPPEVVTVNNTKKKTKK